MSQKLFSEWVQEVDAFLEKAEFREEIDDVASLDSWRRDGVVGKPPRTFFATRPASKDLNGQDILVVVVYSDPEEHRRADGAVTFFPLTVVRLTPEQAERVRKKVEP